MVEEITTTLDSKAKEAVGAATEAAVANEMARQSQLDDASRKAVERAAASVLAKAAEKVEDERRMGEIIQSRVEHVLSKGTEQEKSMILARVPYICQDIKSINGALIEIKSIVKENMTDHETRLRSIEKQIWKWLGLALIVPPVVAIGVAWVIKALGI